MSEALVPSSNTAWPENYYQQKSLDDWGVPFGGGISDSILGSSSFGGDLVPGSDTILTSTTSDDNIFGTNTTLPTNAIHVFTPENSSAHNNDLSPKATVAKQGRRRSRASRKTPTTLLNSSIHNFRTIVQQYTGCQSANSAYNKSGKGPITLSFGCSSVQNEFPAPSFATAFGQQEQFPVKQQHYHQQYLDQMHQGKQQISSFSFGENSGEYSAISHCGSPTLTVENCGWQ